MCRAQPRASVCMMTMAGRVSLGACDCTTLLAVARAQAGTLPAGRAAPVIKRMDGVCNCNELAEGSCHSRACGDLHIGLESTVDTVSLASTGLYGNVNITMQCWQVDTAYLLWLRVNKCVRDRKTSNYNYE